jgi:hypothetical protein
MADPETADPGTPYRILRAVEGRIPVDNAQIRPLAQVLTAELRGYSKQPTSLAAPLLALMPITWHEPQMACNPSVDGPEETKHESSRREP